jgi:hypothetical protein
MNSAPDGLPQGFGINAAPMRTEAEGGNVTDRPVHRAVDKDQGRARRPRHRHPLTIRLGCQ